MVKAKEPLRASTIAGRLASLETRVPETTFSFRSFDLFLAVFSKDILIGFISDLFFSFVQCLKSLSENLSLQCIYCLLGLECVNFILSFKRTPASLYAVATSGAG